LARLPAPTADAAMERSVREGRAHVAYQSSLLHEDGSDEEQFTGRAIEGQGPRTPRVRSVALFAVGATIGGILLLARHPASQDFSRNADLVSLAAQHCHTAVEGETCYIDVRWAMDEGMVGHPEWYETVCPFVKPTSEFEQFQACIYKINHTKCALPCNPASALNQSQVEIHMEAGVVIDEEHPCHIAEKGDDCYASVIDAMTNGILEHAEKYPGLTSTSTFEEFQVALFNDPASTCCPRPCECHTAGEGDTCWEHVIWAQQKGIPDKPDWYAGLSNDSRFEAVQAFLYKSGKGTCSLPCAAVDLSQIEAAEAANTKALRGGAGDDAAAEALAEALQKIGSEEEDTLGKAGGRKEDEQAEEEEEEGECAAAVPGTTCYKDIVYGMGDGIRKNAAWYPELNKFSTFEDFQTVIHHKNMPGHTCPKPCACRTAELGEECYEKVTWVLREGIPAHPDWYKGLNAKSRFQEVQARLMEDNKTTCKMPCTAPNWTSPSLFCFSVFRSEGYEVDLVKAQVDQGAGIFSCDEFVVLSDKELPITKQVRTLKIPPSDKVGISKDGTAANTLIFMKAWGVLWQDARWQAHDWVIKADPDAVVLVERLRSHLKPHTGKNVYMKNCQKYFGPGWPMMFGSLEALSTQALDTYYKGADRCRSDLEWQAWGEDLFMGRCLDMLGASSEFDGTLIGDNVCKGANCGDGVSAVYHPFKSAETWFQCYRQATEQVPT